MWVATTISDLRERRRALKGAVALVPTMGALHAGHMSLVRAAGTLAPNVLVSIFVNPTQFAPSEDLANYPRPIERDLDLCRQAGVTGVFNPSDEQMYPDMAANGGRAPVPGVRPECLVTVPDLAGILEGQFRPTHFQGVCRVVAKLFNIIQPDIACFGRKDYQQLKIIEAMAADLNMPLRIVGLATMREPGGLAMSSRNVYLSPQQRPRALALFKALEAARVLVEDEGETDASAVEAAMRTVLAAHQVDAIDYAVVRHPETLATLDCVEPALTGGVVALVACRVGTVRLIDNMLLGGPAR